MPSLNVFSSVIVNVGDNTLSIVILLFVIENLAEATSVITRMSYAFTVLSCPKYNPYATSAEDDV